MKKISKYILMPLAATMMVFSSCSDDLAQPPVVTPAAGIGTGTLENPFTASQARLGVINYQVNPAWVQGYIVGCIDTEVSTVLNENSADFVYPFTIDTNMLIADDVEPFKRLAYLYEEGMEEEYIALRDSLVEVVAPVQLPSGMRGQLSPVQNDDALYTEVCIQGTTGQTYCGEYGVKNLLEYKFVDSETVGEFFQNFTSATSINALENQGWKNDPTEGNLSGWKVVITDDNNYIATDAFTGFANGGPYEHWLITPQINLDELSEKSLQFESSAANPAKGTTIEVFVMNNNNPQKAVLTPLNAVFAQAPQRGYSEWISSGVIKLDEFKGNIYIGWRYRAEKGGYGNSVTYCIDNINVGDVTPPADWTKATEMYSALGMNDSSGADSWTFDNVLMSGGISRVWEWKEYSGSYYLNASAFYNSTNNPSISYAYSEAINLEGYSDIGLSFDHAAKFQTTINKLGRVVVREVGTDDWTEYIIPAWPEAGSWSFATSGIIDISDYAGKVVEVGFKYESNENGADTWEIRDLKLIGIEK